MMYIQNMRMILSITKRFLETLAYADENKANEALIDSILEKARLRKDFLTEKRPFFLPARWKKKIQEIYKLAEQIKKDFYGNRIVMFAPLYLSNYCVNGCTYCPYHLKNKHIARKQLTQEGNPQRSHCTAGYGA